MTTDVSEKGLEALIVADMTGLHPASPGGPGMAEDPQPFVGLHNWILGNPQDYDRAYTVDLAQLRAFLAATQKHLVQAFDLDHFHEQVLALNKIGGQARAMVVTSGIERAIQYFHAIRDYLKERKSPYRAIVAFSGEHDYGGVKVTEASLNGFPSKDIPDRIVEDPYRFLICADKFQTGYDEPLLHTMYVDKPLAGVKAVQTLSRLNRAHPQKHDVFVLDFQNDTETIRKAFEPYCRHQIVRTMSPLP